MGSSGSAQVSSGCASSPASNLRGGFIGYLAKVPRNEDIPRGHALWFVMRVADPRLVAWGMEAEPLDMTKLGEPISLDIETPSSPSP